MIHTDELYRRIYENAEKEYTEYITALKEKNAEYLIDHAYEIAAMYDIFEIFITIFDYLKLLSIN